MTIPRIDSNRQIFTLVHSPDPHFGTDNAYHKSILNEVAQ